MFEYQLTAEHCTPSPGYTNEIHIFTPAGGPKPPAPARGGGSDLSGIWQSFERQTNAGPVDRYEFRRDGE